MNKYLYSFILAIALCLSGCLKDKDHELQAEPDYVSKVNGLSSDIYSLYLLDTLRCTPTIDYTVGANPDDYDYRWIIGHSLVISETKNLEWEIHLPEGYSIGETIPGSFVVRNKKNGLEFRQTFRMQLHTGFTPNYLALYETKDNRIEWISLQGTPENFTRTYDNMIERINPEMQIDGPLRGAYISTNEIAIFTGHQPDFGYCVSLEDADPSNGIYQNMGEIITPIAGRVYLGAETDLSLSDITFGYGATKYLICNNRLHVFNGLERKLPIFDENTFVRSNDAVQCISSKQYMRYKKLSFVRHTDNHISGFHVYNDQMEDVYDADAPLKLDSLCGMFTEATGLGSNKPYHAYLIGMKQGQYYMYDYYVNYIGTKVQPLKYVNSFPIPSSCASKVRYWFGSFGETYAFYATDHEIYKFDYYEIQSFKEPQTPMITFPSDYFVENVFVQIAGNGLRDEDYCTVALLYNPTKDKTSIYVYDTVSGKKIKEYKDIIPGRGSYFVKRIYI